MSIAEAPARPVRQERWPWGARQENPPEGPDFPSPEPGRVGEPGPDPEREPARVPDTPGEVEPEPDGEPRERMHGYVFEGYYYSA